MIKQKIIKSLIYSLVILIIVSIIFLIGNPRGPLLFNKPVQIISKESIENPMSIYNYKNSMIFFNGWEVILYYNKQERVLGTNYQENLLELNNNKYLIQNTEEQTKLIQKVKPVGFFQKETDKKEIEESKETTKIYWYNKEKDPSKIGYIFTVPKKQFYFKVQLFAETNNPEQLKEAGYGMVIKGYDIYLPNGNILKNDYERIQTNEPKDIILEGVKQDPNNPLFQNLVENKIILKGTNHKTVAEYQIFYNKEKAIIIWGEFDYMDNLFKWEVFRPFFTKKASNNTFKPLYIAILNEVTLNYQNNTYQIQSKEFNGDIKTLIQDWTF